MTLDILIVLIWHLLGTLGFTAIYLCYLPIQAGSGLARRVVTVLPLGLVSAMLLYRFMSWLLA